MEKMLIRGVTKDTDVARISVTKIPNTPGVAFKLFDVLAKHKINVDIILQSIGRESTKDITFTISKDQQDVAMEVVTSFDPKAKVSCDNNISKVSIVGSGMETHPNVAAKMFEALSGAGINTDMITTSEIRITAVVREHEAETAMRAVHERFAEEWV